MLRIILVSFLLYPLWASAGLGGRESSLDADASQLKVKRIAPMVVRAAGRVAAKTAVEALYTVHEMNSDSYTIKEFVSRDGVVFAVKWSGAINPDVSVLFGSYNSDYDKAFHASRRTQDRNHVAINVDDLIVNRRGRAPHLQGLAYVPSLVPSGVKPGELE